MDYKKKYEEALARAREIYNDSFFNEGVSGHNLMERLFPELRESEDEKIRKALINYFDDANKSDENPLMQYGIQTDKVITWLEKQGNKISQVKLPIFTFEDVLVLECAMKIAKITKSGDELYKKLVPLYDKIHNAYLDEKQGEQKVNYTALAETGNGSINTLVTRELPTDDYDDNKNTADKIEPKFHEGDWVVNNTTLNLCHIVKVEHGQYVCSDCSFPITKENEYHLWSIADAKPGDVLACNNGWICIFKTLINDETFSSYCFMDNTKWFCETGSECHTLKEKFVEVYNGKIYPATKEQHDLLFSKMREAGWEWDKEKKELKKIVVPIFNIGDTVTVKHNPGTNKIYFTITDITGGKYWYNDRIICDITEQDEWELEMDVEKEIVKWWEDHYKTLKDDYKFEGYLGHFMENSTIISLAQHFFELGLKINKGE